MSEIITEKEIVAPGTSYETLYEAGENKVGDKLMIRNTTASRLQFRFAEDDDNTFTISPTEKMIIGGFSALAGSKIEVKSVTPDIPSSIRLNIYS